MLTKHIYFPFPGRATHTGTACTKVLAGPGSFQNQFAPQSHSDVATLSKALVPCIALVWLPCTHANAIVNQDLCVLVYVSPPLVCTAELNASLDNGVCGCVLINLRFISIIIMPCKLNIAVPCCPQL